jgi:hypothetical protein
LDVRYSRIRTELMGSTTHVLKKTAPGSERGTVTFPGYRQLLLLLGLLLSQPLLAADFFITGIHIRKQENIYLLDAHVDYRFSDEALEALDNGVPLTLQLTIEIERKRKWWLDADVANLQQRYRLQFHPLSHQYLLHNLNSGAFYAFQSLPAAIDAMGTLRDFPLLDAQLIEPDEKYEVLLQAELDIEALPSPLRPLAYITPAWRLNSDWYTWSLTP